MRINQIISHRPHTGINLDKLSNEYMNAREAYRISVHYFSDTQSYMGDIDDVCDEIRDKDYQVKVKYHSSNIGDREVHKVIEKFDLGDPFETRDHLLSMEEAYGMRNMGIDIMTDSNFNPISKQRYWVCEKSYIKEVVTINITNKQLLTSIEKKFGDGKVLERTKYPLDFELVTSTKEKDYPIVIDDDIEECIERCKYLIEADDVEVDRWRDSVRIYFTLFREVISTLDLR